MVADIFMYIFSVLAIGAIVFMLIKKIDIIIALLTVGIILLIISMLIGRIEIKNAIDIFYPIESIVVNFKKTLSSAGFIILILGGYTAYMSKIGANDVVVNSLTKPLLKIKKQSLLIPIVFLLGNFLSLAVPSASTLAIILMATLFPVLTKTGISPLSAAGVIATTATIMPTPLGSDNVAIATELGMSVTEYVFKFHAIVSLPTIFVMTAIHWFWQVYCDKRDAKKNIVVEVTIDFEQIKEVKGGVLFKTIYTILPLLPIILVLISFVINISLPSNSSFELSVEIVSFISFIVAIICEWIRHKSVKMAIKTSNDFWKGMGQAMGIVVLLVAANVFVQGLKDIGLVAKLQEAMEGSNLPGVTLPLVLVILSALIVLLSGSGTSLIFAMVPLIASLAAAAGIHPAAISIPLQTSGNLLRSMSPVSAVVIIVASKLNVAPIKIVQRTYVPILIGVILSFALSMIFFTTGMVT